MGKRIVLKTGEKFGRLTILGETKSDKHNNVMEKCLCECGNETWVTHHQLVKGIIRSCGCLLSDTAREKQKKNCRKHGLRTGKNRFSRVYQGIRRRCKNPNDKAYPRYGGRGIRILWDNIEEFYKDMYPSYIEHLNKYGEMDTTIDRIDNNGDYCKENCKWATRVEQNNNRRDNSYIEIDGVRYNTHQFAEKFNIKYDTAKYRMRMYRTGKMPYDTLTHMGVCRCDLTPKDEDKGEDKKEKNGTIK